MWHRSQRVCVCARILLLFFSSFCTLHSRIEIGILCSVSQSISHTVLLIVVVSHTHTRSHAHLHSFIPPEMISFFRCFLILILVSFHHWCCLFTRFMCHTPHTLAHVHRISSRQSPLSSLIFVSYMIPYRTMLQYFISVWIAVNFIQFERNHKNVQKKTQSHDDGKTKSNHTQTQTHGNEFGFLGLVFCSSGHNSIVVYVFDHINILPH